MPDISIDPKTGDKERVYDILNDVAQTLAKYGCALIHRDHSTVLVKIEGPGQLRALAKVREISPLLIDFAAFNWTPKEPTKQ